MQFFRWYIDFVILGVFLMRDEHWAGHLIPGYNFFSYSYFNLTLLFEQIKYSN